MSNATQCNFSSINDVIIQANEGLLNITTTVASCQNICQLAWGVGNPDLSGIGANVSYIFQGALTFIFGPLICLAYVLREHLGITEKGEKILQDLHGMFLDITAQFGIPVAIAAIVRFRQHAPFYELSFLRSLTIMQFLSLLSAVWPTAMFEENPSGKRVASIIFYVSLQFGILVGFIGSLERSGASWESISTLTDACKSYSNIKPGFEHIPKAKIHLPHLSVKENLIPFPISKNSLVSDFIIVGFVIAGLLGLVIVVAIFIGVFKAVKAKTAYALGLLSLAFTVGTLVELWEMERTRNLMKEVTGDEFQDDQWGFGQIVALFLWAPLITMMAFFLLRRTVSRWL